MSKTRNKYILLFFAIFISCSFAQDIQGFIDKGNVLVAGTISFTDNFGDRYTIYDEGGKIITIEAKPNILYFITKNIAIGGEFSIIHQYFEELEYGATELGLGPKVSYFTKLGSAYPFFGANIEYLNHTFAQSVNDGFSIGLSTGILAPFTGNAGVLIEAGYRWDKIFYAYNAQTGGSIFLGVGIGGMIKTTKR